MSFRCHRCGQTVKPGISAHKVVIEKRDKAYSGRHGWEIAKELLVCPPCYEKRDENSWANLELAPARPKPKPNGQHTSNT